MGVIQGPTRRDRPRRSRPRAMSVSRKSREHGDAILGIVSGDPLHIDLDALRPRTRGDCIDGARPCPWVGCRHHFYLDVSEIGSIKLNFPELDVADLTESCALDVADRGAITLEATAQTMNLTRERVRQIEVKAYAAANAAPLLTELRSA